MKYKYTLGIVGGTFDHFHTGHKALLRKAFEQCEEVMIGLATEKLYKNKFLSENIENFNTRENNLRAFLKLLQREKTTQIIPIDNFYGNTLEEKNLEALFVTEETQQNVDLINKERIRLNMKPAECVVVPFVYGNDEKKITSERIRAGEIDRQGNAYKFLLSQKKQYILPEEFREAFRQPIGEVVTTIEKAIDLAGAAKIIAVGDVVSIALYKKNHQAELSVVDFKTRRESMTKEELQLLHSFAPVEEVKNKAGTLEQQAIGCVESMMARIIRTTEQQTIVVTGEEDLLVLPVVLFAPLGAVVLYGQFDKGIVLVKVTEEKKNEIIQLIHKLN